MYQTSIQSSVYGNREQIQENIQTHLTFTYNKEPNNISVKRSYNGSLHAIKEIALNWFKSLFEECTVAGGLHRELLSHLTNHSSKFAQTHIDKNNIFSCYKRTNITVVRKSIPNHVSCFI